MTTIAALDLYAKYIYIYIVAKKQPPKELSHCQEFRSCFIPHSLPPSILPIAPLLPPLPLLTDYFGH